MRRACWRMRAPWAAPAAGEKFVDSLIAHVETLAAPHDGLSDDVAVLHVQWATEEGRA